MSVSKKHQITKIKGHNCLKSIPKRISELHFLKSINLSDNEIVHVPLQVFLLPNLLTLVLCNNQIRVLPLPQHREQMEKMGMNLKALHISGNQLTVFPRIYAKLPKLIELYLHNNQLTSVPCNLSHSLQIVTFFNNLWDSNRNIQNQQAQDVQQNLEINNNILQERAQENPEEGPENRIEQTAEEKIEEGILEETMSEEELYFHKTCNIAEYGNVFSLKELCVRKLSKLEFGLNGKILPSVLQDYIDHRNSCEFCGDSFFHEYIGISFTKTLKERVPIVINGAQNPFGLNQRVVEAQKQVKVDYQLCSHECLKNIQQDNK